MANTLIRQTKPYPLAANDTKNFFPLISNVEFMICYDTDYHNESIFSNYATAFWG